MIKNLFTSILYFIIFIITATFILTLFNYFNIFNTNTIKVIKFLIPLLGIIVNSYQLGKKSIKKGYLEGLKFGSSIILIFMLITLITKSFNTKVFIYYTIILLTSTLSSMIGINKKKATN